MSRKEKIDLFLNTWVEQCVQILDKLAAKLQEDETN
jgi:hypothetical protein